MPAMTMVFQVGSGNSRALRRGIVANVAALLLIAGYVLGQAYPSSEAVRLRNSLLIGAGVAADFDWTPDRMPPDFMVDRRTAFPEFVDAARRTGVVAAGDDWAKALALAGALTRNAQDTGAIQSDLVTTYRAIVTQGRGYCADFIEIYLGLAHAAGLVARQWAFSFDGFDGNGHAFVEVYDRQRRKWVFLDVYNNVHAVDAASGEPLGALEFRDFTQGRRAAPLIRRNGPGRLGYPIESKLIDYYRRGAAEWYLWWGNNVFTYDAHPAVRAAGRISRASEQFVAVAAGVHPRIKVLLTADNIRAYERMIALRWRLLAAAALACGLLILLAVQVVLLMRRNTQE